MTQRKSINDHINLDETEEMDLKVVYPFEQIKFEQWMRQEKNLSEKTIDDYIKYFMAGCEVADDELEMNLHELLESYINVIPQVTGSSLSKDFAVDIVEMYHDYIEGIMADGHSELSKALPAFTNYKEFIEDLIDYPDKIKVKKLEVPYKEEFLSWLEKDLHKDYLNAKRDVSALQSAQVWVGMLFNFEDYDLFNRLAEMNNKVDRQRVLDLLRQYKREALPENFRRMNIKKKTVENGLSCLQTYILFLNDREK